MAGRFETKASSQQDEVGWSEPKIHAALSDVKKNAEFWPQQSSNITYLHNPKTIKNAELADSVLIVRFSIWSVASMMYTSREGSQTKWHYWLLMFIKGYNNNRHIPDEICTSTGIRVVLVKNL